LSRHDPNFKAAEEAPLDLAELLAAMSAHPGIAPSDRQSAIACYLSGSEGWRDALDLLSGAFAEDGGRTGLKPHQGE